MANSDHQALMLEGKDAVSRWRLGHRKVPIDLSYARMQGHEFIGYDLRGADLTGANFEQTEFSKSNLGGAAAEGTVFEHAFLTGVVFDGADLTSASFVNAMADGATFVGSRLFGAHFRNTNLDGASFQAAHLGDTTFARCDLRRIAGLDEVSHEFPSTIGIDTLVATLGRSPTKFRTREWVFFEGAGVPRSILDYLPDLLQTNLVQFLSCFISYGNQDNIFAEKLYDDLRDRGLSCWKFDEDALVGRGVWANVGAAIALHEKTIVVCSEHSLNRPAVLREIERALQKEDELSAEDPRPKDTDVLIPIRLDDYVLTDWSHPRKADVVSKVIGDFTGWAEKLGSYDGGLHRLLRTLDPTATLGSARKRADQSTGLPTSQ